MGLWFVQKLPCAFSKMSSAVLSQILSTNQETEIGKKWNFKGISTIDEFRKTIPLTTYDDYKPYIDRIAESGEQNLITEDTVIQFAPSSGTTGKMKLIPVTRTTLEKALPVPNTRSRILLLMSVPIDQSYMTPSKMPIQAMSVGAMWHQLQTYPNIYVGPKEAYNLESLPVALYVQLLFGLKDTTVNVIKSIFIPVVLTAIVELKTKWRQIINDIRLGKINTNIPVAPEKCDALEKLLGGPDPARADALQTILQQAEELNFKDFIPTLWPNVKLINCLCSGNLECFIPTLKYYIGSSVHVSSFVYACSEAGTIGTPAKPHEQTSLFQLVPQHFYEFIPLAETSQDQPLTLLASEVEKGRIYEIVMTTHTGFYRYRNGDYIKVIEQGDNGPLIDFYGRGKMTLCLREHILYEVNIEQAITSFTSTTSSRVDYIVSIDDSTYSRYKIWIECSDVRDNLDTFLDKSLQNVDETYKYDRQHDKIEQLEVVLLKIGTFSKILDFMKSKTYVAEAQLKIPRIVLQNEILLILEQNTN